LLEAEQGISHLVETPTNQVVVAELADSRLLN
jgi:hypothetical protein